MAITTAPGAITAAVRLIGLPLAYWLITPVPAATVTRMKVPRNSMMSPQRPLPEGVFLEPDEVAAPERLGVLGIQIAGDVRHRPFPWFLAL